LKYLEPERAAKRIDHYPEVMGKLMRMLYTYLFPVVWVSFLLYWQIMAVNVKATQRLEPAASRVARMVLFLFALLLIEYPRIPIPWLYRRVLPAVSMSFWCGAAITVAGLGFCVWARRHLGRNWSRSVTIKEDHRLIVTGPYAVVRHPIYTGLLVAFLGTAIAVAQVRGVLAFLFIFVALWSKLRLEERWMHDHFGTSYEVYSRRVAALVPYLL
jgi:protein-S-isoprenylcysteine O-methyltransferase Ste14